VNKQPSSCASERPSCAETSRSMARSALLPTSMSGMCDKCWPDGSVGLGALGGRAASLTRWICSLKRRTLSKVDRLQIE